MPGMNMPAANLQVSPSRPTHRAPLPITLASYVTPLAIPPVIRPRAATVQMQMSVSPSGSQRSPTSHHVGIQRNVAGTNFRSAQGATHFGEMD
jgi:hypothetical protein